MGGRSESTKKERVSKNEKGREGDREGGKVSCARYRKVSTLSVVPLNRSAGVE